MALIPFTYKMLGLILMGYALLDQIGIKSIWRFHAFYTGLALLIAGQTLGFLSGPLQEHVVAIRTILDQVQKAPKP